MMDGFIYLIESVKNKRHYLGSTNNPAKRIKKHNTGRVKATSNGAPWRCLLVINVGDATEARKIEFYIKRQRQELSVKNVIKNLNRFFENLDR